MNLTEAAEKACKEPTLVKALVFICLWESERIVHQARENPTWDTCFEVCIQSVLAKYNANLSKL